MRPNVSGVYEIGKQELPFKNIYVKNSITFYPKSILNTTPDTINLPNISYFNNLDVTDIHILGALGNTTLLPTNATIGDAYIIENSIWACSVAPSTFINVGPIQGPDGRVGYTGVSIFGSTGYTGPTGPQGLLGHTGFSDFGTTGPSGYTGYTGFTGYS